MNLYRILVPVAILSAFNAFLPLSAHAQAKPVPPPLTFDGQEGGWLEGAVLNTQGQPIWGRIYNSQIGIDVKGVRQGSGEFNATSDLNMGGLYSVHNLRPGIYDITVAQGYINSTPYCPQRTFGVVIKPGVRTLMNIVMDQGTTLEERGNPNVPTVPVIVLSEQLAAMQKQIDDLKQQIASLQAKSTTPVSAQLAPAK